MPCIVCNEIKSRMYLGRDDICEICYRTKKFTCESCDISLPFSEFNITEKSRQCICKKCIDDVSNNKRKSKNEHSHPRKERKHKHENNGQ